MDTNLYSTNTASGIGSQSSIDSVSLLIIDDDIWTQRIISKWLEHWGLSCISAVNPIDGIALALKHKPLLILLDVLMPDLDGNQMLKILGRLDDTSHIPIVIISANLSKDILGKAIVNGAKGFISKPFSQKIIYDKMKEHINPAVFEKFKIDPKKLSSLVVSKF